MEYSHGEIKAGSKIQRAISKSVVTLAAQVDATAIVAETSSGGTAIAMAAHRQEKPLIVVTSSARVAQQLAILYGAKTFIRKDWAYLEIITDQEERFL